MSEALSNLGVTLALCYGAWGFFHGFLHKRGVTFESGYVWTSSYFLGVAAVLAAIFWSSLGPVVSNYELTPLLVLTVVLCAVLLIQLQLPKYVQEPRNYFEVHPNRYYLKLGWRRFVSKTVEIAAQQVFIVVLVVLLRDLGLRLPELIIIFGMLFFFLHIPLLTIERGRWPMWAFLGAVIGFSIIFPYFILYVPYGFAYNIAIHWLFYSFMAVTFWMWCARSKHI